MLLLSFCFSFCGCFNFTVAHHIITNIRKTLFCFITIHSDCMVTEFDKIYSVHYTQCRKPWQCISRGNNKLPKERGPQDSRDDLPLNIVNKDHCYELVRHWHDLRLDFEKQLFSLTGDKSILDGTKNTYKEEIFLGHCNGEGNSGYVPISGKDETFKRASELYDVV